MDTHYSERLGARICTQANAFRSLFDEKNETVRNEEKFEPAYAKGRLEFFRYVEDGRTAYAGRVKDDTKKFLGREPLFLGEWAKLHAHELLELAGS